MTTPNIGLVKPELTDDIKLVTIPALAMNFQKIDDEIGDLSADIAAQKADNAIRPESYSGSDYQKLQSAINDSINQNRALCISKSYNLGSNTLVIDKGSDIRKPLFIFGGGKIKKDTAGYMFQADDVSTSDVYFENIWFEGVSGINVTVFDCSDAKLIRLHLTDCHFSDLYNIVYSNVYVQSITINGGTIVRVSNAVFDIQGAFDVKCNSVVIENMTGYFLKHGGTGTYPGLTGFMVNDCILEGFTSNPVFTIKNVGNFKIDGCYFEANANGNIVFDVNADLTGVSIENNICLGVTNSIPFIKWGKTLRNCSSKNNTGGSAAIHDSTNVTSGKIISDNDYSPTAIANVDPNRKIYTRNKNNFHPDVFSENDKFMGIPLTKTTTSTTMVELCSFTLGTTNGTGAYVTIRGGGLQGNTGNFGINKTYKVIRTFGTSNYVITADANDSWGDSLNQKDNIELISSGGKLVLNCNSRTSLAAVSYDLYVEVFGKIATITFP
jgi:hypothetical protein